MLDGIRRLISISTNVCVVSIFDLEEISSLLNMVGTTEESIHLLERDSLGLRNEKPDKDGEEYVNAGKEVEGITRIIC
jgi:hypothetical protein